MKRILAIVLSLALALSVAAVAGIIVSADTLGDTDIWCYVGDSTASRTYAKTAEKSTDGNAYADGASALQAALNDLANSVFTLSSTSFICTNQDITLTSQIVYTGSKTVRFKNLYTLTYAPTAADAALTAFDLNGNYLWLYGSSSTSENVNFVGYNGNAFFDKTDVQICYYFNGDLSFNDCKGFGFVGWNNFNIKGDLIFTGTSSFSSITNPGYGKGTITGNIDISSVDSSVKDTIKSTFENSSDITVNGSIVTGETETGGDEGGDEETTTVKTLFLDAYSTKATISTGCKFSNDHKGYDGSGFVSDFSASGRYVQFNEINIGEATYTFDIRFVNAIGSDCEVNIYDNDTKIGTVTLAYNGIAHIDTAYSEWGYYGNDQSFSYTLTSGNHIIKLENANGKAANIDSLTLVPNAPTITMDEGAAMRIDGTTTGIRFSATADNQKLNAFESTGVTIEDVGMIVTPQDSNESLMTVENAVVSEDGSTETANYKPYVAAKYNGITMSEVPEAGVYTMYGSLVEIDDKNAEKQYVAKAYIQYKISGDSTTHYIYSNLSDARSIKDVATEVYNDTTYFNTLCTKHQNAVTKWLDLSTTTTE